MTTRPPSNDPADVAAWEEERARLREEREFRDDVRTFIGQQGEATQGMREDITALRGDMQAHEQRDRERFEAAEKRHDELAKKVGGHTQIIQSGRSNWKVFYAVLAAAVVITGILWTILSAVSKVPS